MAMVVYNCLVSDNNEDATTDWRTCCADAGCDGRQIEGYEQCLAHLTAADLNAVLQRFSPGGDLDLRGTILTTQLLQRLLASMSDDPAGSSPHLGHADFRYCHFTVDDGQRTRDATPSGYLVESSSHDARSDGDAGFGGARFGGTARFGGARFGGTAGFGGARFDGTAEFAGAQFSWNALFGGARFSGDANFKGARFNGTAEFKGARFDGDAGFGGARFGDTAGFGETRFGWNAGFAGARFDGHAGFAGAQFDGHAAFAGARFDEETGFDRVQFNEEARFDRTQFNGHTSFGPLVAAKLHMDSASFVKRVVVEVEAAELSVSDTRFESGVELRVRHARISLQRTFFGAPSSLSGALIPFKTIEGPVVTDQGQGSAWAAERESADSVGASSRRAARLEESVPQLLSMQETDVSQLTLSDVDLRWCRFAGAHQLDKLRLEGRGPFNRPPGWQLGWAWPPVWRWTSRQVLAEEHPWRARRRKSSGWKRNLPDLKRATDVPPVSPERLAVLYRSLRKAFEDTKNEAGAGDFYYGEMEARRHAPSTGRLECVLLTVYWMISGYGQRASRALAALVMLIGVLFALLTTYGLPSGTALQQVIGTIPAAVTGQPQPITLEVKAAPVTQPPPDQRWTADRMSRAIRIALGSVVFRDADQRLTQYGWWTVMAGRAFGPLLLALAALAIRARVKR